MQRATLPEDLKSIEPHTVASPWPGYEHFRGYAVMVLPFSSGHLLGLRVFPENDFAPYASVWHRAPEGDWSIYNDGPSLDTTCPRWWGSVLRRAELTSIHLTWTSPMSLRVEMEEPPIVWTMSMTEIPLLKAMNRVSAPLPLWTWKPALLLRAWEWMAERLLAMGDLRFSFVTPSGQNAVIMPEQIFFIESSEAMLDGQDLGKPIRLEENPTIGGVALPSRPAFVIGQAYAGIKDPEEYHRRRASFRLEA